MTAADEDATGRGETSTGTGTGTGTDPLDVLIVGAGPTGLALALQLQAYGVRFRLVDRQLDRVRESRALGIQARTLEVLANLGITPDLLALGNRAVRLRLHVGDQDVPLRLFDIGVEDTAYPYLLFLSQAETERIMGEHLVQRGGRIERQVELRDLTFDGSRADPATGTGTSTATTPGSGTVTCQLRHADGRDETVVARYVAGCDGPASTVRDAAGIAFEGSAYPQSFVLADLEVDGLETDWAHAFAAPRGIMLFLPLGQPTTWRLIAMRPTVEAPPVDRRVTLDELQTLVDTQVSTPLRLHSPVWMTNFRLHHRRAREYRAGPVFLAGDAAHIHSPAGAQGMNTGIQDAVNLGWKLGLVLRGHATPALLDTYDPERAPVGREVLRFTDRAFSAATSTQPVVRFARTRLAPRLLPLLLRVRAGRAIAFRTVSELAIRYRSSPLSVDVPGAPRHGPRAGDRIPDAPLVVDGAERTLHEVLGGPAFHVLFCGPAQAGGPVQVGGTGEAGGTGAAGGTGLPAGIDVLLRDLADRYAGRVEVHRLAREPSPGALEDRSGLAHRRLGVREGAAAFLVVRPDGHLGYRAGAAGLAGVHTYLARWLR